MRTSPNNLIVVAGASKLSDPGIRIKVAEIMVHPDFCRRTHDMDIAVLKLQSRLTGPRVGLPDICRVAIRPGVAVQLYGWGETSSDYYYLPDQLQTVTRAFDQARCQSMAIKLLYQKTCFVLPHQVKIAAKVIPAAQRWYMANSVALCHGVSVVQALSILAHIPISTVFLYFNFCPKP
ncbi:Seminase [Eumeta japonica]|uniref:Seminase n=1 Tax=Eumeta variegata TaxID=151549 RepID=A0A4C1TFX4_EUMVA|nr:Seminase [Eumeta japonica]